VDARAEDVDALEDAVPVLLAVEVRDHADDQHGLAAAGGPGHDHAEGDGGQVGVPGLVGLPARDALWRHDLRGHASPI
jgi:hypothetical protein